MLAGYIIVGVFGLWLLATVSYQFFPKGPVARYKNYDALGLLPFFRLFERSVKNIELFYRETPLDPWQEYPIRRRSFWYHILWAPDAHPNKILWCYLRNFSELHHRQLPIQTDFFISLGLISLLANERELTNSVQIQIVEAQEVIFTSDMVRLGPWLKQL